MGKMKIAVIGAGHLGSIHAKLWKENPEAELIGIYDADLERGKEIAELNNCAQFVNMDEAIAAAEGVTIAAPTSAHYEIASKCLENGLHCLVEKPITSKYDEAKKIIEIAEDSGLTVQVGHVERFNPALYALKDYELNPRFIEAHRLSQFKPRAADVSVVHDLMIHDIDITLRLVKSPLERLEANGVSVLMDTPDICNARLTFENGAVANLTASRISAKPMRKMRIFQSQSYISIDFAKRETEIFKILDDDKEIDSATPATMLGEIEAGVKNKKIIYQKPEAPELNAIAEEQKAFIETVRGGKSSAAGAEEAAEALRIAETVTNKINL